MRRIIPLLYLSLNMVAIIGFVGIRQAVALDSQKQNHYFSLNSNPKENGAKVYFNFQQGGSLVVSSNPESGMTIFLNDNNTGKTTPATIQGVEPGEYSVKLVAAWYKTQEKKINISDNQTEYLEFTMTPNYAEITINTSFDGAIFVDGTRKGTTSWKGRVQEGDRNIKVEKENMVPREQKFLVVRGKEMQIDLMMKPRTGGLEIVTSPPGAMIDINGRMYGLTPCSITDLLPGEYELLLTKPSFTSIKKRIRVVDGQTTTLDFKMYSGKEITFQTEPLGADVFLNDSLLGQTPFKVLLDFDSHILKIQKGNYLIVETVIVSPSGPNTFSFKMRESNDPFESQMVLVKGGAFLMGDTFGDGKNEEKPVRSVTVSDFYLSKYEITQIEWQNMMGTTPSHFNGCEKCPVERVSWNDVNAFITKLNLLTGKKYRLPTEAEWEFAARGGQKTLGYRFSGSNNINKVAWYTVNSSNKTQPVGGFSPNELGFYDMSGNVWEWCNDWMGDYPGKPEVNPSGPASGDLRVVRGGSWFGYIGGNRVSARGADDPANGRSYIGFRLALTP